MKKNNLNPNNPYLERVVPIQVLDTETLEVIGEYSTTAKALRTLGISNSVTRLLRKQEKLNRFIPIFSRALNKDVYIKKLSKDTINK